MKIKIWLFFFFLMSGYAIAQSSLKIDIERVELATLRIQLDLTYSPDRFFNTPASGFIINALKTSSEILDEMEKNIIMTDLILGKGHQLRNEVKKLNRKGKQIERVDRQKSNVQVMFFSSGS